MSTSQSESTPKIGRILNYGVGVLRRSVIGAARMAGYEIRPLNDLPVDLDEPTKETIRVVRPFTMTSPVMLSALCDAIRYVTHSGIEGDIVECGVYRGGSMMAAARTLIELGDRSRTLWLFDTFDGMVQPGPNDKRYDEVSAETVQLASGFKTMNEWCAADVDQVRAAMESTGYPAEQIRYVKGPVEQTLPDSRPDRIALLRLDTDWYESTKHELTHLFPLVSPGGVLIIDDYGFWKGSKTAVDEYLKEISAPVLLNRIDTGRICVITSNTRPG